MVCELPVVAQSNIFLFPILIESFVRALVQIALFDRDGSTAAQLPISVVLRLFALFSLLVFLLRRRRCKQVGSSSRFPLMVNNKNLVKNIK